MPTRTIIWTAAACVVLLLTVMPADAQIVEAVGERALGMGGAFVAVANDSSATWWNPAGLADGPFFDVSLSRAVNDRDSELPAARDRVSGFALATPVLGLRFERFSLRDAAGVVPVAQLAGSRQTGEDPVALRAWSGSTFGATLVQTLFEGTHVAATLKYVRGTLRTGTTVDGVAPEAALDLAGELGGGKAEGRFDLDVGALATAGALRLGVVGRNLRAPTFADGTFTLPRQARVGVAFAAEQAGGPPLTIALDADIRAYAARDGQRRVIAVGGEQWLAGKRLGLRAGARFNRIGREETALTAGASVSLRSGSYLEAHVVGGGSPSERGWGAGVRMSF
jgi:hypothetical protein